MHRSLKAQATAPESILFWNQSHLPNVTLDLLHPLQTIPPLWMKSRPSGVETLATKRSPYLNGAMIHPMMRQQHGTSHEARLGAAPLVLSNRACFVRDVWQRGAPRVGMTPREWGGRDEGVNPFKGPRQSSLRKCQRGQKWIVIQRVKWLN